MTYDEQHRVTIGQGSYHGLAEAIADAGHTLECNNDIWYADDKDAVQAIIDGYTEAAAHAFLAGPAWEAIKAERDRRQMAGVQVGDHSFHSDDKSRIQQLGLVMMGASIPAGLQWKTLGGTFVTMTPTLAGQIFAATAAHDQAIFAAAETHRQAMLQAPDPSQYDFSSGWPAV